MSDHDQVRLVFWAVALVCFVAWQLGKWAQPRVATEPRVRPSPGFDAFLRDAYKALEQAEPGAALAELSYAGMLSSGRRVRIWFSRAGTSTQVRLCVLTTRDVPSLRVRPEDAIDQQGPRAEDIQTGDGAFDDRFFLQSTDPLAGARALGVELRRTITQAFSRAGVERLVFKPGELSLEADVSAVSPGTWRTLLDQLDHVAVLVETKLVRVRVLGGERDVVCDPEGKTRCAYCRDGITGDEPDLVACDRCRTVLHDACWTEHGACPMLGCEGEAPERARVGYGERP